MNDKSKPGSHQSHSDPDNHGKDQYKRHVDGSIRVSGQIEVHPPPNTNKAETPEQKKARSYRFLNFVVAAATLLAVVIYAGLTFWQACLTQVVIKDGREHFTKDQRPYVWYGYMNAEEFPPKEGENLRVDVHIVNYGKSPSIRERGKAKMFYGPNSLTDAYKWFDDLGDNPFPADQAGSVSIDPPGIPSDPRHTPGFTTILSDKPMTTDDVTFISENDAGYVAALRIEYFDTGGTFYRTDICSFHLKNGPMAQCHKHNAIK